MISKWRRTGSTETPKSKSVKSVSGATILLFKKPKTIGIGLVVITFYLLYQNTVSRFLIAIRNLEMEVNR